YQRLLCQKMKQRNLEQWRFLVKNMVMKFAFFKWETSRLSFVGELTSLIHLILVCLPSSLRGHFLAVLDVLKQQHLSLSLSTYKTDRTFYKSLKEQFLSKTNWY